MRSLRTKIFLENNVLPFFSWLNSLCHHKDNVILLYINSGLRESNKALFEYLINNVYNEKYQIVVACYDYLAYKKNKPVKNVKYISTTFATIYYFKAKYVFYSIGRIPLFPSKDQVVMQMWHGVPLKSPDEGLKKTHTDKHQYYTWLLSTSEEMAPLFSSWMNVPKDRIYIGGYPRCDKLFEQSSQYDFGTYEKLILWAPTFRKSITQDIIDADLGDSIIPLLSNGELVGFDNYLKSKNVKIVVKLHPAQDISNLKNNNFDNLIILSHSEFTQKGMDIYSLSAQTDALITDYSSIYFDYMLLDRPIAFTVNDMEEYGQNRGFSLDTEQFMPGSKIKTKEELQLFIEDIVKNVDSYKSERRKINKIVNKYQSGEYSKRILEFCGIKK